MCCCVIHSRPRAIPRHHKLVRAQYILVYFEAYHCPQRSHVVYYNGRHYRRAAGALVVYDVTNRASFEHAQQHWLKELKAHADISSTLVKCIALVGNKVDLEPKSNSNNNTTPAGDNAASSPPPFISEELHDAAVQKLGVIGQRASAKTGHNVRKAFEDLLIAIYDEDKGKFQRIERAATIHLEDTKHGTGGVATGGAKAPRLDPTKCCTA